MGLIKTYNAKLKDTGNPEYMYTRHPTCSTDKAVFRSLTEDIIMGREGKGKRV